MKLIKIKGHFYVLSEKKHYSHKIGDWVYEINNCIPVYQFDYDMDEYPLFRVLASTIKLGTLPLIDFYKLQESILQYLAEDHFPEETPIQLAMRETWIERYINNLSDITDDYKALSEIEDGVEFDIELEMEEFWDYTTDFSKAKSGMTFHKITGSDSEILKIIEEDGKFIPILTSGVIIRDFNDYVEPIYAYEKKFKPKINNNGFVNILKIK